MDKERVLLVDDEEEFTQALAERLENRGLRVRSVASGAAAIEAVKEIYYDAVILDMAMPDMDGTETLKELLKVNPDIQVIFLAGHATLEKGIEAVKLGAMDFLEKPVKFDPLLKKISQAKANKAILVQKRAEEKMKNIIGKKGW